MSLRILVFILLFVLCFSSIDAETNSDELKNFWSGWKVQVEQNKESPESYGLKFAKLTSPEILRIMVKNLHNDKSDGRFFAYVLVAINWKPNESKRILYDVIKSGDSIDKIWAQEFIEEINSYQEAKKYGKTWK